jgi:hypothetical protein
MAREQFLFVNKTAKSASLTNNRDEAALLKLANNHVQPRSKLTRSKNPALKSAARNLVGWSRPATYVSAADGASTNPVVLRNSTHANSSHRPEADELAPSKCGQCQMPPLRSLTQVQLVDTATKRSRTTDNIDDAGIFASPAECLANQSSCRCNQALTTGQHCSKPAIPQPSRSARTNKRPLSSHGRWQGSPQAAKGTNAAAHSRKDSASIPNEIFGALDPFLRLPLELTPRERSLLQFCKHSKRNSYLRSHF